MSKQSQSFSFPYKTIKTESGVVPYPVLPVYLYPTKGEIIRREFIADTGADLTTLPQYLAEELGLDLKKLPRGKSQGIATRAVKTWETKVKIKIGDETFKARCSFVASNKIPPLLGKLDVFNHFNLYFDNDKAKLVLTKRKPKKSFSR